MNLNTAFMHPRRSVLPCLAALWGVAFATARAQTPDNGAEANAPTLTAGWDRGFYLAAPDNTFRLRIGGWLQPRFIYENGGDASDTSSFTLRRLRLDIQGHVIVPELTFRAMSEHARTSNLRDGWINYAFDPAIQMRVGQFTVPFQWHRDVGPRRQHFAERGVPSETFGFEAGRDVGAMVHGRLADNRLAYGAGFFDGAGRNVDRSNSNGNMASARLTYAVLGTLPREESDYADSQHPQLSVGGGVQGAWKNSHRDWALGRSEMENNQADWVSGTLDARLAWKGVSLVADGYWRSVDPDDTTVEDYTGAGGMVSAGAFVVPRRLELVGRWSTIRLDRDARETQLDEWGAGLNIYHHGHDLKTRINYYQETPDDGERGRTFLVEWHLQF